mgnify:FL=1
MKVIGILLAAGSSKRFKADKLFIEHEEKELIRLPIETFLKNKNISFLVIVCSNENLKRINEILNSMNFEKEVITILGGKTRHESETLGLRALDNLDIEKNDLIAIHDCARSFMPADLLEDLITEAKKYGSCSPVMKGKFISKTSNETISENIMEIQTPQLFTFDILEKAYLHNNEKIMDSHDTTQQVSKILGVESRVINGSNLNLKITYKEDLEILKSRLGGSIK